ncbi:TonB-dependent receptor [Pseudoalteromonas porphyrae]|uniref:TonB-dependent receptor n=1 Tax=Pseudoalteromonas porphyrae TaxID=187330 RepID=A0A0N1ELS5_9GAMM|nr:TonB-dependent receptor [Pseudoalteromonas porphyrae]KPH64633.1 TonB-dependent receptor [Pseudoalteromonas porphyrae]KPH92954.1 TonB-dependent receptor [Pseudoalteromonas porphyrae]
MSSHFSLSNSQCVLSPVALSIVMLLSPFAIADESIEVIEVHGQNPNKHEMLGSAEQLLSELGVNFSAAGGVSSLPILNGMMGDRVKVIVDGADITAACGNQMNPPLSYISANQVSSYSVIAGISPVSAGGDNIAGVIKVNSIAPQYSEVAELDWHSGYVSAQYRSINHAKAVGVGARLASDSFTLSYQGAFEDADSYDDGRGDLVLDTLYRVQNHALTGAIRDEKQQFVIKLTHQKIPFQGFANQYMDMTDNTSYGFISQYSRIIDRGEFQAQVNFNDVKHKMGFFTPEKTGMMPMNTDAQDISYQLNWRLDFDADTQLLLGQEYYGYRIDDWWPAVQGSMMMGPNDYVNINDGKRDRITGFAELQKQLNKKWWVSAGARIEHVTTNAGEVQGYTETKMGGGMHENMENMPSMEGMHAMGKSNETAAAEFNALDRKRTDTLVDASLLLRYQVGANDELQLGLARKNRAPNLYERYSWGVSTMSTSMIGWFGDGNGYIGNPDLEAETAYTLSASYTKSAADESWQITTNAWRSKVDDYIDGTVVDSFNRTDMASTKRNILKFSNIDATLYGVKVDAALRIFESKHAGLWLLKAGVTATHGERDDSDESLYQIMPLHSKIAIEQQVGKWQSALSWEWVDSKTRVDARRFENKTDSYSLLNIETKATWDKLTVKLAVTNLLDEYYQLPLGGVSIAQYKKDMTVGFNQLAGQGRSVNLGMSYAF